MLRLTSEFLDTLKELLPILVDDMAVDYRAFILFEDRLRFLEAYWLLALVRSGENLPEYVARGLLS